MRREDRQLLAELAKINTALPAFAERVMDNTAAPAEHSAVADRLITLAQDIRTRIDTLTVINADHGGSGRQNLAATHALSALVDMVDALGAAHSPAPITRETFPLDWID